MEDGALLYQPLGKNEIRLLRILFKDKAENKIRCKLEVATLDSCPEYTALSYEWGTPDAGTPSGHVLVNSTEVRTTPNLREALNHLPPEGLFWIDALCINQDDDAERGRQVRMMTQIYQQAHSVTIWLGLETGPSSNGMDLINLVDLVWDTFNNRLPLARKRLEEDWLRSMLPEGHYSKDPSLWNGLIEILRRPYWTRRWIIQELVVTPYPERIQLLCGNKKASFQILSKVLRRLHGIFDATPHSEFRRQKSTVTEITYESRYANLIGQHVRSWSEGNKDERGIGLLRLLHDYHPSLCSDPRDRVYALLGVALPYEGVELDISYTIPVSEVYKNTAKYLIQGSKRLDVLLFCQNSSEHRSEWQPSWVPNWQRYDRTDRLIRYCIDGAWDAAGTLSGAATFSSDGNILRTKAYVLGTVLSKYESHNNLVDRSPSSLKAVLSLWLTYAAIIKDITTELSPEIVEAFYETVVCTRFGPDRSDQKSRFREFHRFCLMCWKSREQPVRRGSAPANLEALGWPLSYSTLLSIIGKNRQLCAIKTKPLPATSAAASWPADIILDFTVDLRMGLCTPWAEVGDTVVVIPGCRHPVLLRKIGERYELVDEIYVHGFMRGEAIGKFPEIEMELI